MPRQITDGVFLWPKRAANCQSVCPQAVEKSGKERGKSKRVTHHPKQA